MVGEFADDAVFNAAAAYLKLRSEWDKIALEAKTVSKTT